MVMVMGVNGSGKSVFVNLLKAGTGKVGKEILSGTHSLGFFLVEVS